MASDYPTTTVDYRVVGLYMADRFTKYVPGSSYTITKATLRLAKVGTFTGTLTCSIYADANGTPGTLVGSSSPVSLSSLAGGGTYQDINFTGLSAPVTMGRVYYVVCTCSNVDGVNQINWASGGTYSHPEGYRGKTSEPWVLEGNYELTYKLYSSP